MGNGLKESVMSSCKVKHSESQNFGPD